MKKRGRRPETERLNIGSGSHIPPKAMEAEHDGSKKFESNLTFLLRDEERRGFENSTK